MGPKGTVSLLNPGGAGAPTEDLLRSAQSRSSTCSHGHTSHGTVKRPWGGEQRPLHLRDLRDLSPFEVYTTTFLYGTARAVADVHSRS